MSAKRMTLLLIAISAVNSGCASVSQVNACPELIVPAEILKGRPQDFKAQMLNFLFDSQSEQTKQPHN